MIQPEVPAYYGFSDVHAFKDFLSAVIVCAPSYFFEEDWLTPEEQMTLDRAFDGLEWGYKLVEYEFGPGPVVDEMRRLTVESLAHYRSGDEASGQGKLEAVELLLNNFPTQ